MINLKITHGGENRVWEGGGVKLKVRIAIILIWKSENGVVCAVLSIGVPVLGGGGAPRPNFWGKTTPKFFYSLRSRSLYLTTFWALSSDLYVSVSDFAGFQTIFSDYAWFWVILSLILFSSNTFWCDIADSKHWIRLLKFHSFARFSFPAPQW